MTIDRRLHARVPMTDRWAWIRNGSTGRRAEHVRLHDLSLDGVRWSSDQEMRLSEGTEVALIIRPARLLGRRLRLGATVIRQRGGEHAARFTVSGDRRRLEAHLGRVLARLQRAGASAPDQTQIALAIRQLALTFAKGTSEEPKLLLVTSSRPSEGKSFVAAGLAAAAAASGQKVLLVDADFEMPTQHLLFHTKGTPGFAQLLADSRTDLATILQPTRHRVTMMAAGSSRAEPALVGPAATADAFRRLRALGFGLVVVDTPPVLASAVSLALGRHADDVLITARAGTTRERDLQRAVELLRQHDAPVASVVLNDHLDVALGATRHPAAFGVGLAREPLFDLLASMTLDAPARADMPSVLT